MEYEIKTINCYGVNCYLVKTEGGFILIDTGGPSIFEADWMKIRNRLDEKLANMGCVPGNLNCVIITHGDSDHTWNCAYLKEKYATKIVMHKGDAGMVENGILPHRKYGSPLFLLSMIVPNIFKLSKLIKLATLYEKFKPDIYAEDGFNCVEYGLNAKIIYLPGHTKGSIGVITGNKDLFCGDILNGGKKPSVTSVIENKGALKESVEKLIKLEIKKVYPGHGRPFPFKLFLEYYRSPIKSGTI